MSHQQSERDLYGLSEVGLQEVPSERHGEPCVLLLEGDSSERPSPGAVQPADILPC